MYRDEIIAEVWRNRDAYAEQHDHDLDKIVADLQRRQKTPLSRIVTPEERRTNREEPS